MRYLTKHSSLLFTLLVSSFSVAAAPWQGPYMGAYFGGAYANNHLSTNTGSATDTSYFTTSADSNAVNSAGTYSKHPTSVIAGIQAGHDWVNKKMVYGVVVDYGVLPVNSSKSVTNLYPGSSDSYTINTSMSTNWLLTLRGRMGWQTQIHWPALFYLTAGMAVTQLKIHNSFSDTTSLVGKGSNSSAENNIGWTAGAGVELISLGKTTVDLQYLFVHMPSVSTTSFISNSEAGFGVTVKSLNSPFTSVGDFHTSLIKIALNYRFDE